MQPRITLHSLLAALCMGLMLMTSCKKQPKVLFIDTAPTAETASETTSDWVAVNGETSYGHATVSVPYREEGGVKYVMVNVNGVGFEMIFDTGCSTTLISPSEANYLWQKGYLTSDDILGETESRIADGSITNNTVINLRKVTIGDEIVCYNVKASVSSSLSAPLLLGNEVLNSVSSYTIDNNNHKIIFTK